MADETNSVKIPMGMGRFTVEVCGNCSLRDIGGCTHSDHKLQCVQAELLFELKELSMSIDLLQDTLDLNTNELTDKLNSLYLGLSGDLKVLGDKIPKKFSIF